MKHEANCLIVGGGIVGLTLAKALIENGIDNIYILEKESSVGCHASGRNSGVLHAGIYYPPNTLKAELCLKGNLMLQEYCMAKGLPLKKAGKVIVARDESELPQLQQLYERAKQNGGKVDLIDEQELSKIEPYAKTYKKALFSHFTAMIDNKAILSSLYNDLLKTGKVHIFLQTSFLGLKDDYTAKTTKGFIKFKNFYNTSGAYADKVAKHFGVAKDYYFIPFKGIYRKIAAEKSYLVNGNIYPVPNLKNPFLGVHFSKNIFGDVYVGPTAIPAFGRENYGIFQGIDHEIMPIVKNEILLFFCNKEFRQVALDEPKKYFSSYFYKDALRLVKELKPNWLQKTKKSGIRPQLISLKDKKLIMDFLVIKEGHSLHILNAISPAFTSSMAFAQYLVKDFV